MRRYFLLIGLIIVLASPHSYATVTVITNKQQWINTIGEYNRIGFTEYPEYTVISNQYANQGVQFTPGECWIDDNPSYVSDGKGLKVTGATGFIGIHTSFVQPVYAFAVDLGNVMQMKLYSQGDLIYSSGIFHQNFTPFVGFVSTKPFDLAWAVDPVSGYLALDNIYLGTPVPAPGVIAALITGAMIPRRRRAE